MHISSDGVLILDFTLTRSRDQAQCQGHERFDSGYLGNGDDSETIRFLSNMYSCVGI